MTGVANVPEADSALSEPVADLVPHRRVSVVFGLAGGEVEYDSDIFDDVDEEIVSMFEES